MEIAMSEISTKQDGLLQGGTGKKLGDLVVILSGVAALIASLITILSIWLQTKNYRKPLLQRYVVRILVIVPVFAAASWASLVSLKAAFYIDPLRDVYEAFTIYAFLQLLINFIGGERALIIMMNGRPPVSHLWPLSYCLAKVDISDPHTFLAIKRGILQYTWIKPLLGIATIIMKATGTYKGGYTDVTSGYFWSGLVYNISITVCLYALALFWICMSTDLKPFRPMPKFLCIKGIIFASYWQGFMLSIFVAIGAIPGNVPNYTPDNLAAAIQDALICFEMPAFAIWHWYAFSWHDYADVTISAARMPVKFALRDAFGPRDLIEDAKETLAGNKYEYRQFDAQDDMLAHDESAQREARLLDGMRYTRSKGKYWIPKPSEANSKTPLLKNGDGSTAVTYSHRYGTTNDDFSDQDTDEEEERLYKNAHALEFGDWNYPVITAHFASREDQLYRNPHMITSSTNRNLLQPTKDQHRRRKSQIESIQEDVREGKQRAGSSNESGSKSRRSIAKMLTRQQSSSASSTKSDRSQLVDLVVEDEEAEEVERVRARKEGSPEWNHHTAKHFVRTYPDAGQVEEVREGHEPRLHPTESADQVHNVDSEFVVGDEEESEDVREAKVGEESQWRTKDFTNDEQEPEQSNKSRDMRYDTEDRNVWDSSDR